jgi:hypothetical protein
MHLLYAALDRHVTTDRRSASTCHQYALGRLAAPSLVHERPDRTLILKDVLTLARRRRHRSGTVHGPPAEPPATRSWTRWAG